MLSPTTSNGDKKKYDGVGYPFKMLLKEALG
jgi:hypothetical protein